MSWAELVEEEELYNPPESPPWSFEMTSANQKNNAVCWIQLIFYPQRLQAMNAPKRWGAFQAFSIIKTPFSGPDISANCWPILFILGLN